MWMIALLVAAQATAPSKPPAPNPRGRWLTRVTTSKMDDSKTVALSLAADTSISGWPGKTATPTLMIRCKEGEIETYVVTGMTPMVEYGTTDVATVQLRFDKQPAEERKTESSTDSEALFFQAPKKMIAALLDHQRMLFRFVPFNSSPQETSFSLGGLKAVIAPLYGACDWSPEKDLADKDEALARSIVELKDPEWLKRAVAAKRLGEFAEREGALAATAAIPGLIEALEDADQVVRNNAAIALGQFGLTATSAVPALKVAAADRNRKMRELAEEALRKISGP